MHVSSVFRRLSLVSAVSVALAAAGAAPAAGAIEWQA